MSLQQDAWSGAAGRGPSTACHRLELRERRAALPDPDLRRVEASRREPQLHGDAGRRALSQLLGLRDEDLSALPSYVGAVAEALEVPIAVGAPIVGRDAFRTATGVHAAAVVKAFRKGDRALMDAVYAAVPATLVGREQQIEVGPMSGRSNVVFWLESRGLPATDETVDRIFAAAKASNRVLTSSQIMSIVEETRKVEVRG